MRNQTNLHTDNLLADLQHRVSQLEALSQYSIDVSRSLDIGLIFSSLCQAVTRVVDAGRSAVFVLDLGQGMIALTHADGLSDDFIVESQAYPFAGDMRARCLHTMRPDLIGEVSQVDLEPGYEQLLQREGIGAFGNFPLISPDGPIGYLSVYFDESHTFSAEELEIVQSFTALAAMAVSNTRLHERTDQALSRRVRQLSVLETISRELAAAINSDRLYEMILDYSMEFTNSSWGMFSVYDPEKQLLQVKAQRGYRDVLGLLSQGKGIPWESIQQQIPINIPDLALVDNHLDFTQGEARAHLSTPLILQSCALGALSLESEYRQAFSDSDVAFVSQLASQAAIALQNARLFADISSVRDRLSAVLNSVHEGILLIDQAGQVALTNDAVGRITGLTSEDIQSRRLDELPEMILSRLGFGGAIAIPDQLLESSKVKVTIDCPSGEKALERSVIAVKGESERAAGWVLVLRDVSDEKRVTQEREQITETLVHDLKSPISAVLGALEVVESSLPAGEAGQADVSVQALQIARRGAQRVLGLADNLLDIARMQSGKLELTRTRSELHKVAAVVINEFLPQSMEYGVILQNKIPADWPPFFIDQAKITRVFANLIDNALKYSPSGAQVIISGVIDPQRTANIRISDRGPGIPAEYREKIFERFGQIPGVKGRRRGTGLGLTFCRLTVEAHGGRIWVEPNASGGSDFVFTIPLVEFYGS